MVGYIKGIKQKCVSWFKLGLSSQHPEKYFNPGYQVSKQRWKEFFPFLLPLQRTAQEQRSHTLTL